MMTSPVAALTVAIALVLAGCSGGSGGGESRGADWTTRADWLDPDDAHLAGDVLVVDFFDTTAAFSRSDGALRWQAKRAPDRTTVAEDAVVTFDDGNEVVVYDLASGRRRFTVPVDEDSPAVATEKELLVSDCDGRRRLCTLRNHDLAGGALRWEAKMPGPARVALPGPLPTTRNGAEPRPLAPTSLDFVVAEVSIDPFKPSSRRKWQTIRVATGEVVRSWDQDAGVAPSLDSVRAYYVGDVMVLEPTGFDGRMWSYDVDAGQRLWGPEPAGPLEVPNVAAGADPAFVGGSLLVRGLKGPQIVDVRTGRPRWTGHPRAALAGVDGETAVMTVPLNADAPQKPGVIDATGTHVAGLDVTTGKERWSYDLKNRSGTLAAFITVSDGRIVVRSASLPGDGDDRVEVRDLLTGRTLSKLAPAKDVLGAGPDWVATSTGGIKGGEPARISLFTGR